MAVRQVAVLDADVLVPILTCDLLLSAFDRDLYRPVVTPTILDEVSRNLHADFPGLDPVAVDRRVGQVEAVLRHHVYDVAAASALEAVNAKDRHVATIAAAVGADLVVTNDRRLRRELREVAPPIESVTADEFARRLAVVQPDALDEVVEQMAAKRRNPPVTAEAVLDQLRSSMPSFVAALEGRWD